MGSARRIIEVRYHTPTFAASDIRRYIGDPGGSARLSWPEVAHLARGKPRHLSFQEAPYLMSILSPEFHVASSGLYLLGMPPHGVVSPNYAREHGRFYSEGLNNHV